jgi:hypothetical protein
VRPLLSIVSTATVLLAVPGSASAAPTFTPASGAIPSASGGLPWTFTIEYRATAGVPGVCSSLRWAWHAGEPLANGETECTAAAVGGRFSLYVASLNGLDVSTVRGSAGDDRIRLVGVLADRKVARVLLTTKDGVQHRLRTTLAPRGLRRRLRTRLRVAWLADAGQAFADRTVGFDRRSRCVATWRG